VTCSAASQEATIGRDDETIVARWEERERFLIKRLPQKHGELHSVNAGNREKSNTAMEAKNHCIWR
jgi:hypothetical protein